MSIKIIIIITHLNNTILIATIIVIIVISGISIVLNIVLYYYHSTAIKTGVAHSWMCNVPPPFRKHMNAALPRAQRPAAVRRMLDIATGTTHASKTCGLRVLRQ